MKRLVLIEIAIIFICCACRKYEDGPWFSLTSPEKRIEGEWKATKVIIDDNDKTYLIDSLNIGKYDFHKASHDLCETYNICGYLYEVYDKNGNYNWDYSGYELELVNKNKTIAFNSISYTNNVRCHLILLPGYMTTNYAQWTVVNGDTIYHTIIKENWEIHRLSKKEMTLSNNEYGENIKIYFEKI